MSFDRLRTFLQTLRFRLTLWNGAVILVLLVVNTAAIRAGLKYTLSQMVNEFLNEELESAALDFKRLHADREQLHDDYNRQATRIRVAICLSS